MTENKPIIIDGVDVSECKFYSWECEYPYYNEYCTHSNHFVLKRKTCKGCKGFINEVKG